MWWYTITKSVSQFAGIQTPLLSGSIAPNARWNTTDRTSSGLVSFLIWSSETILIAKSRSLQSQALRSERLPKSNAISPPFQIICLKRCISAPSNFVHRAELRHPWTSCCHRWSFYLIFWPIGNWRLNLFTNQSQASTWLPQINQQNSFLFVFNISNIPWCMSITLVTYFTIW